MIGFRKNSPLIFLLITVLMLALALPVVGANEQDNYMELNRLLHPNQTAVEAGSEQDINYFFNGDEFELDPDLVDTNYLLQKNIALVLDVSGSMNINLEGSKSRLDVLQESAIKFLDYFVDTNTKISIIPYQTDANLITDLIPMNEPSSYGYLRDYILNLYPFGSTNIGDGMRRAYWQLQNTPQNSVNYVIVMTDGSPNIVSYLPGSNMIKLDDGPTTNTMVNTQQAINYARIIGNLMADANITSYFVGLTTTFSASLEEIALSANAAEITPGNHYYTVTNANDMENVFSNILVKEITSTLPMQVNFNETLPIGVEVVDLPVGLTQSVLADGRVHISGQLMDISLQKNDVTGKYTITPWNGTIRVKYKTAGVKNFDSVQVTYIDPFGNNKSAEIMNSVTVQVTDTLAPTTPILSLMGVGGEHVELGWTASSDNVGVAGYNIYKDGVFTGTTAGTAFTVVGLSENTNYSFTVTAFDAAGNESVPSNAVMVHTPDVTAPSAPSDLHLISKTSSSVTLAWSESSDNVGVAGYHIYRDGVLIASAADPEYTDTGLTNGQIYHYAITALDAAGNESEASSPITVMANLAPIANAGSDTAVEATSPAGALVTFNGSGSTDPDFDPITYTWSGVFGTMDGVTPTVQLPIGIHIVTLTVSDGDLSSSDTVEIQVVDTIPPEIMGSRTPLPNANGWNNTDVTVYFTASDSGSGVQSVTPNTVVSTEGDNQSVTGTAVDGVGNTATITVGGIRIDKTGPSIVDATLVSGSYKTTDTIIIDYMATDTLSGLDEVEAKLNGAAVTKGQSISLQSKAGNNVLEITATDRAGNVTVETFYFTVHVNVDVNINPKTLNPKSKGGDHSVTVKIDFPASIKASSVDLQTVKMSFNGSSIYAKESNYSNNNRSLTVKFNRQDLIALIGGQTGTVSLTVSGNTTDGEGFVGSNTIKVLSK